MNALALLLIGLLGLNGTAKHRFDEATYVRTLLDGLDSTDEDTRAAAIDELHAHAAHPVVRADTDRLLALAETERDNEVRETALQLIGDRGAPVTRRQQARLLVLARVGLGRRPRGSADRRAGWAAWAAARTTPEPAETMKTLTMLLLSFDDFTRAAATDGLMTLGGSAQALLERVLTSDVDEGVRGRVVEAWMARYAKAEGAETPSEAMILQLLESHHAATLPWARRAFLEALLTVAPDRPEVLAATQDDLRSGANYFTLAHLKRRGPEASPLLREVLQAVADARNQGVAMEAAAAIAPPGARPAVAAAIEPLLDSDRAYLAAQTLTHLGAPGFEVLKASLRSDSVKRRRHAASAAPDKDVTVPPELLTDWQAALAGRLALEPVPEVRSTIVAYMKVPAACPVLLARAAAETDEGVLRALARTLGDCGAPATEVLMRWARPSHPAHEVAQFVLPKTSPAAGPAVDLLFPIDGPSDSSAHRAVARLGAPAVPHLIARLHAKSSDVRGSAAYALGVIGHDARPAGPSLALALDDPDPQVRRWAAWAFIQIEDPTVVPELVSATTDPNYDVRQQAVRALGKIGGPIDVIIDAARAEPRRCGEAAAEALAERGEATAEVEAALIALISEKSGAGARAAARAATRLGLSSPNMQSALRTALTHERAHVRWAAAEALLMVGTPQDILPALVVRRAAPKAADKEDAATMRSLGRMLR